MAVSPDSSATCSRCGRSLADAETFTLAGENACGACWIDLAAEYGRQYTEWTADTHYVNAFAGALAGVAVGGLALAGSTALPIAIPFATEGLGILIGLLVGIGTMLGAGRKRGPGLQWLSLSVTIAGLSAVIVYVRTVAADHTLTAFLARLSARSLERIEIVRYVMNHLAFTDVFVLAVAGFLAWRIPALPTGVVAVRRLAPEFVPPTPR